MKVKVKDIRPGDVVVDRTILPQPTRVAEIDDLKNVIMIRYACREYWYAYATEQELEVN